MQREPAGLKSTTNSSPTPAEHRNYKNNNKKQTNKNICPFACPTCQSLGDDLVKSKYEIINILSDTGDSIFSPMHEQYHDYDEDKSIRNGKVFLSTDLINSFFQNFKK
jgi:hypothetical protein